MEDYRNIIKQWRFRRAILIAAAILISLPNIAQAARPSLSSMDQKLNDLLAGQEDLKAQIEDLRAAAGLGSANCNILAYTGTMWGLPVTGVDLRAYTGSTLHFIGVIDTDPSAAFFCQFNPAQQTLTFGASGGILRSLLDVGDSNGADMSGGITSCASAANPDAIHNAPDKQLDAQALCSALGYSFGSVEAVASNTCPEPNALDSGGSAWESDFVNSQGYGKIFSCAGFQ